MIQSAIKSTKAYQVYRQARERVKQNREVKKWEANGRPSPPPHLIKQQALANLASLHNLHVLVETGTFNGDMVQAMRNHFDQIYSIELSEQFYRAAVKRFSGVSKIVLIPGDSGTEIKNVVAKLDQPALFWLDGHYSAGNTAKGEKETPVFEELGHIFDGEPLGHVIVIDDARCFGTDPTYPTMKQIGDFVTSRMPSAKLHIENDGIQITFGKSKSVAA